MSLPLYLYNTLKSTSNFGLPAKASITENLYEKMSILYREHGIIFDTRTEYRNVLGIRAFTPLTEKNSKGLYDDIISVAYSTKKGARLIYLPFSANLDPSYQYSSEGAKAKKKIGYDVDEDGKPELGMLPTGFYKYHATSSTHKLLGEIFRPKTDNKAGFRVHRDVNHDGYFTDADEKLVKNQDLMYEGQTMYFHEGIEDNTNSAGCQTIPRPNFETFRQVIQGGRKFGEFSYLLVNTW
jgi:hypothetical protein